MSALALIDSSTADSRVNLNQHSETAALLVTDLVLMLELNDHTKPTKLAAGTNRVTSLRFDGGCSSISTVLAGIDPSSSRSPV